MSKALDLSSVHNGACGAVGGGPTGGGGPGRAGEPGVKTRPRPLALPPRHALARGAAAWTLRSAPSFFFP